MQCARRFVGGRCCRVQALMICVQIADFGLSRVLENNATRLSANAQGEACISPRTPQGPSYGSQVCRLTGVV